MADSLRIARAVSLMAGNGIVLQKLYDLATSQYLDAGKPVNGQIVWMSAEVFLGIVAAFFSLWPSVPPRRARQLELLSGMLLLAALAIWLHVMLAPRFA